MLYFLLCGLYLTADSYSFLNEYNKIKMNNNQKFLVSDDISKGIDMRYPLEEKIDSEKMRKIIDNINKKKIVNTLENKNISIYDKLSLIQQYHIIETPYSINILSGGLMDDYNYTI
tara:strand:- start:673 stop:1020 length:348 start_codon:yes stop_codon:yes gene_type:complete